MKALRMLPPLALLVLVTPALAGEEDWGASVNGLSCRLTVPGAEVPMGARPELTLHLRYDGPPGYVRNRHMEAGRVRLSFRDLESGKVHHRTPDDGSCNMPDPFFPDDIEPFAAGSVKTLALPLRLLTKEGGQLPPGDYSVTAAYTSRADAKTGHVEVPGKLWAGRIVSPPVRLRVVQAGPAEDTIRIPSRVTFRQSKEGLAYGCDREDASTVVLPVRPGYFLTVRTEYSVSIGGGKYADAGMSLGVPLGAWSSLDSKTAQKVRSGASLAVRMKIEVLETSWPMDWHMAFPENGDHKVLWRGEVAGVMPDSVR